MVANNAGTIRSLVASTSKCGEGINHTSMEIRRVAEQQPHTLVASGGRGERQTGVPKYRSPWAVGAQEEKGGGRPPPGWGKGGRRQGRGRGVG